MVRELTVLLYFGSQLPAPPPRTSTKNEAISRQYAIVRVEMTRTKVDVTIQYRRLYFDVDASEMAPIDNQPRMNIRLQRHLVPIENNPAKFPTHQ